MKQNCIIRHFERQVWEVRHEWEWLWLRKSLDLHMAVRRRRILCLRTQQKKENHSTRSELGMSKIHGRARLLVFARVHRPSTHNGAPPLQAYEPEPTQKLIEPITASIQFIALLIVSPWLRVSSLQSKGNLTIELTVNRMVLQPPKQLGA